MYLADIFRGPFAVAILALCPTTPVAAWSLFGPSGEEVYLDACEEVLKDRLRSPSSYKLIQVIGPEIRPATRDEYLGWDEPEKKASDEDFIRRDPAMKDLHQRKVELFERASPLYVVGYIRYEAANGFGASIQGAAKCSYTTLSTADEALSDAEPTRARINGYTKAEWSIRALRQLQD